MVQHYFRAQLAFTYHSKNTQMAKYIPPEDKLQIFWGLLDINL